LQRGRKGEESEEQRKLLPVGEKKGGGKERKRQESNSTLWLRREIISGKGVKIVKCAERRGAPELEGVYQKRKKGRRVNTGGPLGGGGGGGREKGMESVFSRLCRVLVATLS